jgi:hypothetical protein
MADGIFYNDLRDPAINSDIASVTLSSTNKALYPVSNFPVLGGNYFGRIGKKMRIRLFGRGTTGATPGNGQWALLFGTGADNNGTTIASNTATALAANQTNISWWAEFYIHCRATGSSGTLFATGLAHMQALASAAPATWMIPTTAPAVSGSIDLTQANIVSVQFNRSGSTAETLQVHDMEVIAMN